MSRHTAADPRARLAALFDPDSIDLPDDPQRRGVVIARGRVDGHPVLAFATDPEERGGSLTVADCDAVLAAQAEALRRRIPIVGVWHSGGAGLSEGPATMDRVARLMRAVASAAGKMVQLSVIVGPCAGAAAYASTLSDLVVMAPEGRLVVTGPGMVASLTGEQATLTQLGGPQTQSRSGAAHLIAVDEPDAYALARALIGLLADHGTPSTEIAAHPLPRVGERRDLVTALLDPHTRIELQPAWGSAVVTCLGRLGGRTVGVLANDPGHRGGWLDADAADKGTGFIALCVRFSIPIIVLADVPGMLPGLEQECGGALRRGAALFRSWSTASIPRVTVVIGKAYGGAFLAMNAKGLGATRVLAWPQADLAVMPAEAAVRVLYRRELAALPADARARAEAVLITAHARQLGGVAAAVEAGAVDEVIEPEQTRSRIAAIFAELD